MPFRRRKPARKTRARKPMAVKIVAPRRKPRYKAKAPLALKLTAPLSYAVTLAHVATVGAVQLQVFTANGLYDPDITNVGHQPRGFDQLMALYDHYYVNRSSLKVSISNTGAESLLVGITPYDTATPRTQSDYMENRKSKILHLGAYNTAPSVGKLFYSINPGVFLGRKPANEDDLKGSVSANPLDQVYFHLWTVNTQGINTQANQMLCYLDYNATFIEPKQPVES